MRYAPRELHRAIYATRTPTRSASPKFKKFIGSLDSRGANQGVFITTSSFQPAAEKTIPDTATAKSCLLTASS
ncbi:restriction endonuclease [Corynebacterium lactis]|uniref:restriction endonuclease n=1 Tax=Corynebacterium lactis TaxID=1231000 RepID=UPI003CCB9126